MLRTRQAWDSMKSIAIFNNKGGVGKNYPLVQLGGIPRHGGRQKGSRRRC